MSENTDQIVAALTKLYYESPKTIPIEVLLRMAIERTGSSELIQHQAEAWCHMVAELVCDFGLDTTEPGQDALEQVQNFLRRNLRKELT